MRKGLLSGIFWGISNVLLGYAMSFGNCSSPVIISITFAAFNDIWSNTYLSLSSRTPTSISIFDKEYRFVVIAALLSGPIGMLGYVVSIMYMGSSISAASSAIYPAIGCILARIFLKDKVMIKQWIAITVCCIAIYLTGYTSDINITNFWAGLIGTLACSIGWGLEAVIISWGCKKTNVSTDELLSIKYKTSSSAYLIILILIMLFGPKLTCSSVVFVPISVVAAVFGVLSYKNYYAAIDEIGASKAMACNMTYVAWALLASQIYSYTDYSLLTYVLIAVIIISGIIGGSNNE